jgi:hypothetical protein
MTEPAEPRRYRRFPVQFTAEISGGAQLMVCEASDIGAGGCCATVLFPLQRGQEVRVRLRSDRVFVEPAGAATVAWTSRTPPYKVGLAFSPALAEAAVPFLQGLLGPVKLTTGRG